MLNKYEITEIGPGVVLEEVFTAEILILLRDHKSERVFLLKTDMTKPGLLALKEIANFCGPSVEAKVIHPANVTTDFEKLIGVNGRLSYKSAKYQLRARWIYISEVHQLKLMADFKTRVLIVDDSKTIRILLEKIFSDSGDCEVVGSLGDPTQVMSRIEVLKPDVMTLDIHMPELTGVEVLRSVMPRFPIPTVMISSIGLEEGREVLTALELGAVDYIQKPSQENRAEFALQLLEKIKMAAAVDVRVSSLRRAKDVPNGPRIAATELDRRKIVFIGSSTGGTEAIRTMFRLLPPSFPPILITQHIPKLFSLAFAESLKREFKIEVYEAKDGQEVLASQVLIAPGGMQMEIHQDSGKTFVKVFDGPAVNRHKPSVDVLFESAAKVCGKNAIGVILTGMGADGAKGLMAMRVAGAATIGQDEVTSVVYGMPKVAFETGAVQTVLPLNEITARLIGFCQLKKAS